MSDFPKGSEWRKWDLHFHTPSSYDIEYNATNQEIIDCLVANNISVVAITDHHIIDVDRISELTKLAKKIKITVLPGIEFLSEARGKEPIHFIAIFSEKANIPHIWGQISNKTKISEIQANRKKANEIYCDLEDSIKLIHDLGGIVTIHAGGKSNSLENITHALPHGAAQKRDIANIVDIFEVGKTNDIDDYKKNVFPAIGTEKTIILCSDTHNINKYNTKTNLWIKGDPNFSGLKQAILETERVFVGEIPPSLDRIKNNKTKTLEKLKISWVPSYSGNFGEWFKDIEITFNPEMTAIIGNKGSGKTAIAEITALLCNAKNESDFIFLQKDKFRRKKLASNFIATLDWCNGVSSNSKNLNDSVDLNSEELIHFVPQRSFEKFCNESDDDFVSEINNVVFSRMAEHERLGFSNFDDLVENQKASIEKHKNEISIKIKELNSEIKELEVHRDNDYKTSLQNSLKQLELEIKEHNKIKPNKVNPPENLNTKEYKALLTDKKQIEEEINTEQQNLNKSSLLFSNLTLINSDLQNFEKQIKNNVDNFEIDLEKYNISMNAIFTYSFNYKKIMDIIEEADLSIKSSESKLSKDVTLPGELVRKLRDVNEKINKYNLDNAGKLSKYQKYIDDIKVWNDKDKELDKKRLELIQNIEYIGDFQKSKLAEDIDILKSKRIERVIEIFDCIRNELSIYDKFKSPIERFIESYRDQMENYDIKIDTGIYVKYDFVNTFVDTYINNIVDSPFKGSEGLKAFREIVEGSDFSSTKGLIKFIKSIQDNFENNHKKCYHNMFKKDKYNSFVEEFYNLKFLEARYSLRLFEKALNELSPGERGSLLLVFYLLLDARDLPLVLDQPEDNLDNESVAKVLVPFIREAKKRRQIIIVTHNANLAVVSDAEQIIRVKLNKTNSKFSFESGSLESNIVNDVVDVLEGTKRSFHIRNDKYNIGI